MSKDDPSSYGPDDNAPWPTPYRADTDPCLAPEPRLPRRTILSLTPRITCAFLDDERLFARYYRDLVRAYHDGVTLSDLSPDYLKLLRTVLESDLPVTANEHDFANLHRAVWLRLYRTIVCLLNFNIHGDWGDPPGGGTSQGREGYVARQSRGEQSMTPGYMVHFHTTPNGYGSYAISTSDIKAPDLGVAERRTTDAPEPTTSNPLPPEKIACIARSFARRLLNPDIGDRYLEIVKAYYRDRANHTDQYVELMHWAPSKPDPKVDCLGSEVDLPAQLGDQDVANIHRGAWLLLAHRFSYLVGTNPFGGYGHADASRYVDLPVAGNLGGPRRFEVPNKDGVFTVNLNDIDPDDDL